jgi:hypothetical protein
MIDQRINSCLTFYQRKCPQPIIMERYFLFPQILNAIDIALAEGMGGETLHQRRTTMASEIEKRQHGRIAVRYLTRMVTSRSVMWKAKQRI